jgi:plastocyanin
VRRWTVLLVVPLMAVLVALPAHAAGVSIVDFGFSPRALSVAQGASVRWQNTGSVTHTSTQDAPLRLWNTGHVAPGTTSAPVTLRAAGSYAYHCAIHSTMRGAIRVPIIAAPATGSTATTFTITLASAAQAGFLYDVQRRAGTGPWTSWRAGVRARIVGFSSARRGSFSFRSRLRRIATGAVSGWSPAASVTVA